MLTILGSEGYGWLTNLFPRTAGSGDPLGRPNPPPKEDTGDADTEGPEIYENAIHTHRMSLYLDPVGTVLSSRRVGCQLDGVANQEAELGRAAGIRISCLQWPVASHLRVSSKYYRYQRVSSEDHPGSSAGRANFAWYRKGKVLEEY